MAAALSCVVAMVTLLSLVAADLGTSATMSSTRDHRALNERCDLSPGTEEDTIRPLLEVQTKVTGCSSKNVSHRSQEVHVVRVDEPDSGMKLLVRPRLERSTHAGPLVVLLWTPLPTRWQLTTQRLPNGSKIETIVSASSEVVSRESVSLTVLQREGSFEDLLAWTESHYGVLTSFSKLLSANSVVLKVGVNQTEPARCERKNMGTVDHVEAYLVQKQEFHVCKRPSSAQEDREIHVVKLGSSLGKNSVVVQLIPKPGATLEKTQVLVLKCESKLGRWEIESDPSVQGAVEIMTEDSVTSEATSYYVSVKVRTVPLPEESESLLHMVKLLVGPANSYTQVARASRIQVFVRSKSLDQRTTNSSVKPTPPFSLQHFISFLPENGRGKEDSSEDNATQDLSKKAGDRPMGKLRPSFSVGSDGHLLWLTGRRRENNRESSKAHHLRDSLRLLLAQEMALNCLSEKVRVVFPSPVIEYVSKHILDPEENVPLHTTPSSGPVHVVLTLRDSSCRAHKNQTHYILESPLRACNASIVESIDGATVYRHEVLIWLLRDKRKSNTVKEGFVDDEDGTWDHGSGFGIASTDSRNILVKELLVTLGVQCFQTDEAASKPSSGSHWVGSGELLEASTLYSITLYEDAEFSEPVSTSQTLAALATNAIAYIQLEIRNVSDLCVMARDCWLTNTSHTDVEEPWKWLLLKNGCPYQQGVRLHHLVSTAPGPCWRQFSFKVEEQFSREILFLKCSLDACSATSNLQAGIRQCRDPAEWCADPDSSSKSEARGSKLAATQVLGPLVIFPRRAPFRGLGNVLSKGLPTLQNSAGEQQQLSFPTSGSTIPIASPGGVLGSQGKRHPKVSDTEQQPPVIFVGVMMEAVVGIAFSSFAIGMALVAAMWYIHTRTVRQLKEQRRQAITPRAQPCCRPRTFPVSQPPSASLHLSLPLESST